MNKRQKIVQQQFLNNEELVIKRLKQVYRQSLKDIEGKAKTLQDDIERLDTLSKLSVDAEEKEQLLSMKQAKVYQKQYQDALKKQVGSILDNMQVEEFKTVSAYLQTCYEDGFIGTMYDLQGQGIPLIFPLDQEAMVRAVQLDSKISVGLYTRLGEDVAMLKKKITAQVSRGISSGMSYQQIAQQLEGVSNIGFNNAVRIARTEGHRIQTQGGMDACYKAKDMGADVVKQWDSTLDGRTRESHQAVDGEIRELDEKFSNGLMFPGDPAGRAAEVINCRCALLQRAKWALDDEELETLKERAEFFGLDKSDTFEEYKKKYLKAVENVAPQATNAASNGGIIKLDVNNYSAAFRTKTEIKNTQKLTDYVNGIEGADQNVLKLYKSIGRLERYDENGIKFTISHAKGYSLGTRYNSITGNIIDVKLTVPKLTGENISGQVQTTLHEQMHLIDALLSGNPKKHGAYFGESFKPLQTAVKKTSADIGESVKKLFDDFHSELKTIQAKAQKAFDDGHAAIEAKYLPNGVWGAGADYKTYEKEYKKLKKTYEEAIDYENRNAMGGGISNLEDIYDALSGGVHRDTGIVRYGHGRAYYSSVGSRCNEIVANYGALSVLRPDLVELLKQDKPDLVKALEEMVIEMGKKV